MMADESGRRKSPSVDLQMLADSIYLAQVSQTPSLSPLNHIEADSG